MDNLRFAARFANPVRSPIRELFQYISRPGMISFAGGYPSPSLLDAEGLRDAGQKAMRDSVNSLQYGATKGVPIMRETLAELCATRGIHCDADDMLVTTGSQQGFDLAVRAFIEPGDPVYVETPAYPGAIQALRLAGAQILEAPIDADGLQTDHLEALLQATAPADWPKLVYCVPTFSNPSGGLLSQARREALVQLALRHRFLIVEDDPYSELTFNAERVEPLFAVGARLAGAANPVIYLASLSKTVAPALRIGWMVAPQEVLRRCTIAKQTVDLCSSPLNQLIATEYLRSGRYPTAVAAACAEYAKRMQALVKALTTELHGRMSFIKPKGGMFLWAEYSQSSEPRQLLESAVNNGVVFVPGKAFYPTVVKQNTMRLSYAAPTVEEIRTGVTRLASAFHSAN